MDLHHTDTLSTIQTNSNIYIHNIICLIKWHLDIELVFQWKLIAASLIKIEVYIDASFVLLKLLILLKIS